MYLALLLLTGWETRYFRSPLYVDKLIYHALVVWLHLVGFSGDPQNIAELLGLTVLR